MKSDAPATFQGSHPLVTVLLCAAVIAAVIFTGSYFSKQRSLERDRDPGVAFLPGGSRQP